MQTQTKYLPPREMHKYVLALIGVFLLFAVTYPIACLRVSQDQKFAKHNFHLKSLTLEGQLPNQPLANQTAGQTIPESMAKQTAQALGVQGTSEAELASATSQTAEITDSEQLASLNQKLYNQIAQKWQTRRFEQKLIYRVSVSQDGAIASYEPFNQPASDYAQQTPLPILIGTNSQVNSSDRATSAIAQSPSQQSFGKFEVVFTRQGILEVSPWQGWRK